jgi:hypothetical protein
MALQTEVITIVLMDGRVLVRYLVPEFIDSNGAISGTFVQVIESSPEAAKIKAEATVRKLQGKK